MPLLKYKCFAILKVKPGSLHYFFLWATLFGDKNSSPSKYSVMKKLLLIAVLPLFLHGYGQKWAKQYDFVNDNAFGVSLVKKDGKYGYVNKDGDIVVPLQYDEAVTMVEGHATVRMGSKWGYIDSLGKKITDIKFEDAMCFHEGLAACKLNGKWGYINAQGGVQLEFIYENARSFQEGLAAAQNNRKYWGFINKSGKAVIPFTYTFANNFDGGLARVMKGETVMFIDQDNNVVEQ